MVKKRILEGTIISVKEENQLEKRKIICILVANENNLVGVWKKEVKIILK